MYLLLLVATTKSEVMDYRNHDFLLYKDTKDVFIYQSYPELFHKTNISFYRDITNLKIEFLNNHYSQNFHWEISHDLKILNIIISQIILNISKRGINELGTIWKWIAERPGHDDFITVQNKIDDLVQNN